MISTMLLELPGTYDGHQSAALSYFNGFVVQTQLLDHRHHGRTSDTSDCAASLKEADVVATPEFAEMEISEVEVTSSRLEPEPEPKREPPSSDVDLTSLNWLHNLNIMSVPSLPTPPISPAPTTHVKCKPPSPKPPEPEVAAVDYRREAAKPPYSYAQLICTAMAANNNRMTLSTIYSWIRENFLYYQLADPSWQNSIRHNLSLNKHFVKVPRSKDEPGKGGFWKVDFDQSDSFGRGMKKRKGPPRRVRYRRSKNFPIQPSPVEKQLSSTTDDVSLIGASPIVVLNDDEDLASMFLSEENWDESQLELLDSILNTL